MTALSVFRTVVDLGSFSQASRALGLSPAAISKNVAELEAHLGVRLLNRTTRRMSLTEAGMAYHDKVARILDDLEEADGSIGGSAQAPRGRLRISAPVTLTLVALAEALPAFLKLYPDIALDVRTDDRRVDLVRDGYDLAVRGSDLLEDSGFVARKLTVLKHVLCASPAYFERHGRPQTPADLRGHTCVQFSLSDHADAWTFVRGTETVRVPVDGRYKISSSLAVREALVGGFGLSLIPELYVRQALADGRLVTALADWRADETGIYAVYPSRRFTPAKVRVFIDFLIGVFEGL